MAGGVVLCGQGWMKMAGEGTLRAFWRGNGTNVCKNIPEVPSCPPALLSARQSSNRHCELFCCWWALANPWQSPKL